MTAVGRAVCAFPWEYSAAIRFILNQFKSSRRRRKSHYNCCPWGRISSLLSLSLSLSCTIIIGQLLHIFIYPGHCNASSSWRRCVIAPVCNIHRAAFWYMHAHCAVVEHRRNYANQRAPLAPPRQTDYFIAVSKRNIGIVSTDLTPWHKQWLYYVIKNDLFSMPTARKKRKL